MTVDDFVRAGASATRVNEDETLVCSPAAECLCVRQLECPEAGCITLERNLEKFRAALARDTRTVYCELADTGRWCDLSYFRFEGDLYRWETRYFGADGRLVAQRTSTDYPAYCDGQSTSQITGRVPDCEMEAFDVQVLCSQPRFASEAGKLVNPRTRIAPTWPPSWPPQPQPMYDLSGP